MVPNQMIVPDYDEDGLNKKGRGELDEEEEKEWKLLNSSKNPIKTEVTINKQPVEDKFLNNWIKNKS